MENKEFTLLNIQHHNEKPNINMRTLLTHTGKHVLKVTFNDKQKAQYIEAIESGS